MGTNAFLRVQTTTAEQDMFSSWDILDSLGMDAEDVTEHMFARLDANVIRPKFDRARRLATRQLHDGPHKMRCRTYKFVWDRIDEKKRRNRLKRRHNAEMHAEAIAHTCTDNSASNDNELFEDRRPAYAACADYYYETMFNPEAIAAHDWDEEMYCYAMEG